MEGDGPRGSHGTVQEDDADRARGPLRAAQDRELPVVTLCPSGGLSVPGDGAICPHHHTAYGDDWADGNRLVCAFVHRHEVPPRLPEAQRDDFWNNANVDA